MRRRSFLASAPAFLGLLACSGPSHGVEAARRCDPVRLREALDTAARLPRLHALIAAVDGRVVAEQVFRGPGLDEPANIKSASKSVLAALTGAAIARGVLSGPDQRVAPFLRDRFPTTPDPRLERVTVAHLLSMRAGLGSTSGAQYGAWASSPDWVRAALERPFEAEPGGPMIYSTGTSHLLSAVLTRASGRSTLELAREWLGRPLGIEVPAWPTDPQGVFLGGNEMRMSPRSLLAFGELYRNGGLHGASRVLPESWIATSWTSRGRSAWSGDGYGYGWWIRRARGRDVYYAWGYGGQMVFVVPDLGLTAVMTSDPSPAVQGDDYVLRLHDLLDGGLIPAVAGTGTAA